MAARRLIALLLYLTLRKLSQNRRPDTLLFLARSMVVDVGTATFSMSGCHSVRERDGKAVWYNPNVCGGRASMLLA
jgi:hypothetical protein